MTICQFHERKKTKELESFFKTINEQEQWRLFATTMKNLAERQEFSKEQARRLVLFIAKKQQIRQANIQLAAKFGPFSLRAKERRIGGRPCDENSFGWILTKLKTVEYKDALNLIFPLLNNYPETIQDLK